MTTKIGPVADCICTCCKEKVCTCSNYPEREQCVCEFCLAKLNSVKKENE